MDNKINCLGVLGRTFYIKNHSLFSCFIVSFLCFSISIPAYSEEFQPSFEFGNVSYASLGEAEAVMKNIGTNYQYLQQTDVRFNPETGVTEYTYTVPGQPAFQVGPAFYSANTYPECTQAHPCFSEQEALTSYEDARESRLNESSGRCDINASRSGDWSSEYMTNTWSNIRPEFGIWGIPYFTYSSQASMNVNYGWRGNPISSCEGSYLDTSDLITKHRPYGCTPPRFTL